MGRKKRNRAIKIGRVTTSIEDAFNSYHAFSPTIYYSESSLNALAKAHPDNYLKIVQEIGRILEKPDLICNNKKELYFVFFRLYANEQGFRVLGVKVMLNGHPNRWIVSHVKWYTDEMLTPLFEKCVFRRVSDYRKKRKSVKVD